MRRLFPAALTLLALLPVAYVKTMAQTDNAPAPPVAKKIARTVTVHGTTLSDEYFWMRDKKNPEVIKYLEAENAYTDAQTKHTAALQEKLYKEMLSRIKETDTNVPWPSGGYLYYTRTEAGKQYATWARRKGSMSAPEEVLLDLNEMVKGHPYMSVADFEVSDDTNLLAYSTDSTGYREYTLNVKDLRTGAVTKIAERVSSVAWANDNKTLFYVVDHPQNKNPYQLYRHTLGKSGADDLVYEEKDEMFGIGVERSRSHGYIFLTAGSHTTSEVRYLPADKPSDAFRLILPRETGHEYYADHHGDTFYIRTNEAGSRNFKLVSAPVSDPRRENWKEVIPHRAGVMMSGVELFKDFYVVNERGNATPRLRILDYKNAKTTDIPVPEPVYSISLSTNREYDTGRVRYNYQSFVTPSSVYDYDVKSGKSELLKQQPVLGGYDPKLYNSERVYATASDGTKVPVSLVYRKDLKLDGSRPLLLDAYGSYGIPRNVGFSSNRLSLLDRGVVFATAHIRGGGDLGKEWHDAGKMMTKKNTFTDFIAAAEYLVNQKYTSRERLVITGGSAGGLLMGAVVNMRPDLFKAVVAYVPFVDVINTELDDTLPLTAGEWEEWGNPVKSKENFQYMLSYSPYDNVAAKDYPAMLVKTSLNDSQVLFHEPTKWVAKLRSMKTDKNPLLLKVNMGAGHGGASGRYDALREAAFDYAFMLTQMGINE
ncbi:MAG TPA: S9 family peptidase [Pyrinomonadaceae bacterium]|jgi:oligopeptidase B|nr:S9 family peptidase [Pyrinomonadaceae bacterium]